MKKCVRRVISLIITLTIFMSGIDLGFLKVSAQEDRNDTTVINVTDYGADSSGSEDSARAIQNAIEAVRELNGQPAILNFPMGEYQIYPDYSQKRDLYVSNTSGINESLKNKTIGILLEDLDNVTLEGNGSTFMFHGKMTTFSTIRCNNITFQNFDMDFQVPTVIDLTVEETGSNYAVVYIPECYNYRIDGSNISWISDNSPYTGKPYWTLSNKLVYTQRYDLASGLTWRGDTSNNPIFNGVSSIEDMGGNRVKFNYSSSISSDLKSGICYQMRYTVRDTPGTLIWESKDILLKDLNVNFLHGFGMVGQFSENLTYDGVIYKTPVNSGRTTAGYADFIQMSGCKGLVDIKNCVFSNPHDDPINIHGTFLQVVEKIASNKIKVRYMHSETGGFPNFYVGNEVEFMTRGNMVPVENSTAVVTAVDGPNAGSLNDIIITLDRDLPSEISANTHVVENITYTPQVSIKNNVFQATPTRGILVTTRKPVLIEDNYFDGMAMSAIYISNDASAWYESGPTTDVTIRNNVFDRCTSKVIFYDPTGTPDVNRPVHSNSLIEGNTFNIINGEVLNAKSVGNLIFRNNTIHRYEPEVNIELGADKRTLKVGESQTLNINKEGNVLNSNIYSFNACNKVQISGNSYDGGLNARANISGGMSNNEAYINIDKDENVKIGQDNKLDSVGNVYIKSSDEEIVAVSDSNTITAKKEGKAILTAYSVLNGRTFASHLVEFNVKSELIQPDKVTIMSDGDTITDLDQTIQFTGEVYPSDADDKTVNWSVLDPVSGAASIAAAITTSGLLTAKLEGTVIVQAETVNGVRAQKLVNITLPASDGLKSNFTVKREDKSGWKFDENQDAVSLLAQGGSLWATGNSVSNIIVTDFAQSKDNITATVKVVGKTKAEYEEPGIIFYKDDDNYTTVQRKHGTGSPVIAVVNEIGGSADESQNKGDIEDEAIYFKLEKTGTSLKGYYSTDALNWTEVGMVSNTGLGENFRIGIIAGGGNSSNWFTFQDLIIGDTSYGFKNVNQAPSASELLYTLPEGGKVNSGDSVGITYTFNDPDGDEEGDSLICWLVSDTLDGEYSPVTGLTGNNLNVQDSLVGKYVKAAVIPEDANHKRGQIVYGEAFAVGDPVKAQAIITERAINDSSLTNEQIEALSADSSLNEAAIEGAGFESFDKDKKFYITTADAALENVNINLKAAKKDAVIKLTVNDQILADNVNNVVSVNQAALIANHNIIEAAVTAPNGVDKSYYRFIIMRKAYNNKDVSGITIDGNPISGFSPSLYEYTIVENEEKTVHIEASKAHASSSIWTTAGKQRFEGNSIELPVKKGENKVVFAVKPDSNNAASYYVVNIKVPREDENRLESMRFSDSVAVKEEFDPELLSYTGISGASRADLSLTAKDPGARIKVYSNGKTFTSENNTILAELNFYQGLNNVLIVVTAKNGLQRIYTVQVQGNAFVYADNTNWESYTIGYGTIQIDKESEGLPITLMNDKNESVVYPKGIGTHADSDIIFNLEGKGFEKFQSYAGVDYSMGGKGSVTFTVLADGKEVYRSQELTSRSVQGFVDLDLTGVKKLVLRADKGANNGNDHANWADAKFISKLEDREDSQTYTVNTQVNGNGTIISTAQEGKIYQNDSLLLTFVPDEGESFLYAKVNGEQITVNEMNQYIIPQVNKEVNVEAFFTGEVQECSCRIENLELVSEKNVDLYGQSSKMIPLKASAELKGNCTIAGHAEKTIGYEFRIDRDTTNTAIIENGNELKVTRAGEVSISVSASIEGTSAAASVTEKIVVTNTVKVTSVVINPEKLSLEEGKTAQLTVSVLPENAVNKNVTWRSDKENIVRVDQTGKITAVSIGKAIITAVSEDGELTGSCTVTVTQKPVPPIVKYTVKFNPAGGTVSPDIRVVESGKPIGTLPVPRRSGYNFKGWFNGSKEVSAAEICRSNMTLTAKWAKIAKPGKVTGLQALGETTKSIKLTWKKVSTADSYVVSRYDYTRKKWSDIKTTKSTSYTDSGRKTGVKYKYRVYAKNAAAKGSYSSSIIAAVKPAASRVKTQRNGKGAVKISWKKVKADSIQIQMKRGRGKYSTIKTLSAAKTSYVKKGLRKNTKYSFRVRAVMNGTRKAYGSYSNSSTVLVK